MIISPKYFVITFRQYLESLNDAIQEIQKLIQGLRNNGHFDIANDLISIVQRSGEQAALNYSLNNYPDETKEVLG